MLKHTDQENLFRLVSNVISRDLECYAFGGTAMMFYGFKDETKDVDILFEKEEDRKEFLYALHQLGFSETNPIIAYIPQKLKDKHKPVMYKRDDYRFDAFVHKIFKTLISPKMKDNLYAVHDYKGKHNLRIKVVRKEFIVMLKAVTDREKDFEDILAIVRMDTHFDWQYLIDEVIWQSQHGDSWVVLDVEETLQELKQYVLVEEKYFEQLYRAKVK